MDSGDCVLLENYDEDGKKHYGLIDAGINTFQGFNMSAFLSNHGVNIGDKLDFFLITHCHGDHVGKAWTVLDRYEIDKLYVKEFDETFSSAGVQNYYEDIIGKAINNNIKVIGVSSESLTNEMISPGQSANFRNIINSKNQTSDGINIINDNFEGFNQDNIVFSFGSSQIKLINWKMYYKDGTEYKSGTMPDKERLKISNENSNSLGVLLNQGNKKVFLGGDLNNIDDGIGGAEDRVKYDIGKLTYLN